MTIEGLPLAVGAVGSPVRDLQQRLIAAGFPVGDELGAFGPATEAAVRQFQERRGLVVDGVCGRDTWSALVEAGYHLGDRLLYLRSPMLRGDDVAELQRQLDALGFDAGRIDGIFGPATEHALKDFERNAGLTTDGVCGPDVLAAFRRLGAMALAPAQVAGIRERDRLERSPRQLAGRRIVIGNLGGLDVAAATVARELRHAGATPALLDHPDRSVQATQANSFDAELYVGLCVNLDGCGRAAYYATDGFESVGGRSFAETMCDELDQALSGGRYLAAGMRLPILRETRMPAVVCYFARVEDVVERAPQVAKAVTAAVTRWAQEPIRDDKP